MKPLISRRRRCCSARPAFAWAQSSEPAAKDPVAVDNRQADRRRGGRGEGRGRHGRRRLERGGAASRPRSRDLERQPEPESTDLDLAEQPDTVDAGTDRRRRPRRRRPVDDRRGRPHAAAGGAQLSAVQPGPGRRQLHPALRAGRAHRARELEPADRRPGATGEAVDGRDGRTRRAAVGGPYEPTGAADTAMAGDGSGRRRRRRDRRGRARLRRRPPNIPASAARSPRPAIRRAARDRATTAASSSTSPASPAPATSLARGRRCDCPPACSPARR